MVTFVGSATDASASGTLFQNTAVPVAPMPAGIASGDVAIVSMDFFGSGTTVTLTGYASQLDNTGTASDHRIVYTKLLTGSETSVAPTMSVATWGTLQVYVLRGLSSAAPSNKAGQATSFASGGGNFTNPSLTIASSSDATVYGYPAGATGNAGSNTVTFTATPASLSNWTSNPSSGASESVLQGIGWGTNVSSPGTATVTIGGPTTGSGLAWGLDFPAASSGPPPLSTAKPHGPPGDWTLTFEDLFPGSTLNSTFWNTGTGVMNNVQCFASNVIVNNGLTLQLANSNSGAEIWTTDPYNLPVGSVCEALISFPGPGGAPGTAVYNWPAWWTSGPNWPYAGEIDIAEGAGAGGTLTSNYHGPGTSSHNDGTVPGNWSNGYHTYTLRRNAASYDIWYDGQLVEAARPTGDNGAPQSMILNVGGGAGSTPAFGAASFVQVQYVRQWVPAAPYRPAQVPLIASPALVPSVVSVVVQPLTFTAVTVVAPAAVTVTPQAALATGTASLPGWGPGAATALAAGTAALPGWSPGAATALAAGTAALPGWGPGAATALAAGTASLPGWSPGAATALAAGTASLPGWSPGAATALAAGIAALPGWGPGAPAALATGTAALPGWGPGAPAALAAGTAYGTNPALPAVTFTTATAQAVATAYLPGWGPGAGLASGTGSARSPGWGPGTTAALAAGTAYLPGWGPGTATALATGTAYSPGVTIGGNTTVTPGVAAAAGAAYLPGWGPGAATALAAGTAALPGWGPGPAAALAAGTAKLPGWGPGAVTATAAATAYNTLFGTLSPGLEGYGFGSFPQIPATGAVILSVIAGIVQYGSDAGIAPPSYELWDGTSTRIGSPVAGTASTTPGNRDYAVFTGVLYSQLATLRLRITGGSAAANTGATFNVDAVSLSVTWAPNANAAVTPGVLAVIPAFPAASAGNGITVTAGAALAAGSAANPQAANFISATAAPGVLAVIPAFPAASAGNGITITAGAAVAAGAAYQPLAANFINATAAPARLAVIPAFPAAQASNSLTVTAGTAAASGAAQQPAVSVHVDATAAPGVLAVVPAFPAPAANGIVVQAFTLAVVPALPAVSDITAPGWAAAQDQPAAGAGTWANPGNVTGSPDGSNAVWTVP